MESSTQKFDWKRALFRYCFVLGLVLVLTISVAVGAGEGIPDPSGPCFNPGLLETSSFLLVLPVAMAIVEGVNWAAWAFGRRVDLLFPTGRIGTAWGLGLLFLWFELRGPTPCRVPDNGFLGGEYLIGALLLGWGLLALFEVALGALQKRRR